MGLMNALYMGDKGGRAAAVNARALKSAGVRKSTSASEMDVLESKIYAPMGKPDKGVGPRDVIHRVQDAMAPVDYIMIQTDERIKEALAIVMDAKEMFAKVSVKEGDYHELAKWLDARAMVLAAELYYRTSLLRKESRAFQWREDYPNRDDANWLKWIIVKKHGDDMDIYTEDIPFDKYDYQPDGTVKRALRRVVEA
jgi:succinate dehydrogenase/fumarate reductase flavoprotein subunit